MRKWSGLSGSRCAADPGSRADGMGSALPVAWTSLFTKRFEYYRIVNILSRARWGRGHLSGDNELEPVNESATGSRLQASGQARGRGVAGPPARAPCLEPPTH